MTTLREPAAARQQGGAAPSSAPATHVQLKRALGGMSYDDQVQMLTPRAPVQRYQVESDRGGDTRVSDDGKIAVAQETGIGGQTAFATPDLIGDAAAQLADATSVITLKAGGHTWESNTAAGPQTLVDVVPVNMANKTEDTDMELWADCGRSAATVSGMDEGSGNGAMTSASYEKDGETKLGDPSDWMEIQKVLMFVDLFTTEMHRFGESETIKMCEVQVDLIEQKLALYRQTKFAWAGASDDKQKQALAQQMALLASQMDELAREAYERLSPEEQDAFDQSAKINIYADPDIGEAFHVSTGGPDKRNGKRTWNFHWAGVVMKSGGDTMTLENYSVSDYDKQNKSWAFQLYGVGKKGQSMHEEHRDGHGQHGENPTTMTATRPPP